MGTSNIQLKDLIDLENLQSIQDSFAAASGVASIIIDVNGNSLTSPSNFCRVCELVSRTERGAELCDLSNKTRNEESAQRLAPVYHKCASCGFVDASAPILIGEMHVANWLMGQANVHDVDRDAIRAYAREIGADVDRILKAFDSMPRISLEQFEKTLCLLDDICKGISSLAYRNLQLKDEIIERERAERSLRDEQRRLSATLRSIADGVIVTDKSGRVTLLNHKAEKLIGWKENLAIGRDISEIMKLVNKEDFSPVVNPAYEAIENNEVYESKRELALLSRSGTERSILLTAAPIRNHEDEISGVVLAFHDISEIRRLQEFAARAQRLEVAGRVAAQVAHDFNNLLAPVKAYPRMIKEECDSDSNIAHYASEIEKAGAKITEINQQLLTLGRRANSEYNPLSLNEIVLDALSSVYPLAPELTINLELDSNLPEIYGSKSQLFRVVVNILNNARDAMSDRGQVSVKTQEFESPVDFGSVTAIPSGQYLMLSISDSGEGIDKQHMARIFEPFFSTKTSDRRRGSGLGLSVAHSVMSDHDGYIDCLSSPGEGTVFRLFFPLEEAERKDGLSNIAGGSESILIIGEESRESDSAANLLNKIGYRIQSASSCGEGLKLLKSRHYDLLILDLDANLESDCTEILKQAMDLNPLQKVLIISGREPQKGTTGFDEFLQSLPKPFTLKKIASAVRCELDRIEVV